MMPNTHNQNQTYYTSPRPTDLFEEICRPRRCVLTNFRLFLDTRQPATGPLRGFNSKGTARQNNIRAVPTNSTEYLRTLEKSFKNRSLLMSSDRVSKSTDKLIFSNNDLLENPGFIYKKNLIASQPHQNLVSYSSFAKNKLLNNQINLLTRLFLLETHQKSPEILNDSRKPFHGTHLASRDVSKTFVKLLVSNMVQDRCFNELSNTLGDLSSSETQNRRNKKHYAQKDFNLKKTSFLAYWLLPFLALIPSHTSNVKPLFEMQKFSQLTSSETHVKSESLLIPAFNKCFYGQNCTNTDLQSAENLAVVSELVQFYLNDLEQTLTQQRQLDSTIQPVELANKKSRTQLTVSKKPQQENLHRLQTSFSQAVEVSQATLYSPYEGGVKKSQEIKDSLAVSNLSFKPKFLVNSNTLKFNKANSSQAVKATEKTLLRVQYLPNLVLPEVLRTNQTQPQASQQNVKIAMANHNLGSLSGLTTQNTIFNSLVGKNNSSGPLFSNYLKYVKSKLENIHSFFLGSEPLFFGKNIYGHVGALGDVSKNTTAHKLITMSTLLPKTTQQPTLADLETAPQLTQAPENAMSIVLNHKKFGQFANSYFVSKKAESGQEEYNYIVKKKDLQKKHKAKKQRLETRRQKKRKRFYPRPTWLRLRLGMSMAERRQIDQPMKKSHTTTRLFVLLKPYNQNPNFSKKPDAQRKLCNLLTQFKTLELNNQKAINPLNQTILRSNHLRTSKTGTQTRSSCSVTSKWQQALNTITYNQVVYNLILSKNLITEQQNLIVGSETNTISEKNLQSKLSVTQSAFVQKTKKYKAENQKLADFVYQKDLLPNSRGASYQSNSTYSKATLKKLINIKNNGDYVNFSRKPANQTASNDRKDTNWDGLKDFWIWLYNTTNTNNSAYTKTILVDTVLMHLSVPINLAKQSLGSTGQKVYLNISEKVLVNNTEYNKKALKLSAWALNKTNLLSTNNNRLAIWATQKLRNQSKNNKTKFIEKQFKKTLNSSTAARSLLFHKLAVDINSSGSRPYGINLFSKLASRINTKIHQKESKLAFLTGKISETTSRVNIPTPLSVPERGLLQTPKGVIIPQGVSKDVSDFKESLQIINTKFFDNFNWWSRHELGCHTTNKFPFFSEQTSFLEKINLQRDPRETSINVAKTNISLLIHFCGLISLISISQIRCFMKFHLILLHKLANGYLQIVFKAASLVQKYINFSYNRGAVISLFSKKLAFDKVQKRGNTDVKQSVFSGLSNLNLLTLASAKKINFRRVLTADSPLRTQLNRLTKTSPNTHWSYPKLRKNNPRENQVVLSTNIKNLGRRKSALSESTRSVMQNSNKPVFTEYMSTANNKSMFRETKILLEKSATYPLARSKIAGNLNTKEYQALLSKNLEIFKQANQIKYNELRKETIKTVKKQILNGGFQIVDTFEGFLRVVYSIFEKPYEFTMDWIAYAFLVEWSSDILAYTPQNASAGGAQAKNWATFARLAGQNQIFLGTINWLLYIANSSHTLVNTKISLTGFAILNQFITKRILYLNDLFMSVLYRPDTDLIVRQKKGTLFWDIWSDLLLKAADKYNINVPSLSNIKEEQNVLLENFLAPSEEQNSRVPDSKKTTLLSLEKLSGHENKVRELDYTERSRNEYTMSNTCFGSKVKLDLSTSLQGSLNDKLLNVSPNKLTSKWLTKDTLRDILFSSNKAKQSYNFNLEQKLQNFDFLNLAQQSVTYQSKETDLFLEYHPPKSFKHISAIKYYSMVQQPIGSLVCQIYSGILEKQISKNVLVIGSTLSSNSATNGAAANFESMQKTLLIQALAGETEMKIITDNASRYAVVSRGFAVGIKYLKEVFEAITLNTPCLFLLEDIHLIGERRPQLISDHGEAFGSTDGQSKSTDATFGAQRSGETVHEKNQISYQLTRHTITHYKKPFKGDFSLAIPSNHFAFDFFLKSSSRKGSSASNFSEIVTHPLGLNYVDAVDDKTGKSSLANMHQKLTSPRSRTSVGQESSNNLGKSKTVLSSSLQLKSQQNSLLSPPSTSPFSVLLLKEQKKLKAKKIVNELPWIGLPTGAGGTQQVSLLPRVSYSVRAKVSALAELGFSNMSAKLDMITDLLVIIDSVRGHRGFVVFATTHLPHILDPALRRPGRLDETISIPTLSNLWTRWEFSKTTFENVCPTKTRVLVSKNNKFLFKKTPFATPGESYYSQNILQKGTVDSIDFFNLDFIVGQNHNCVSSFYNHTRLHPSTGLWSASQSQPAVRSQNLSKYDSLGVKKHLTLLSNYNEATTKYISKLRQVAYYQMGKKFFTTQFSWNLSSFNPVYLNPTTYTNQASNTFTESSEFMLQYGPEGLKYKSLFNSPTTTPEKFSKNQKTSNGDARGATIITHILLNLLGGKFTEYFALTSFATTSTSQLETTTHLYGRRDLSKVNQSNLNTVRNNFKQSLIAPQTNNFSLYGIDQTWRAATSFTLSLVQKRYLFNQNLVVPKLLNFLNYSPLEEAPSPPSSNILVPAKRFENAKKGFKETIQSKLYGISTSLIQEKLESHKKQAYIRNIYKAKSNSTGPDKLLVDSNYLTYATNSLVQVTSGDVFKNKLLLTTNANWLYQKKIYNRHKIALTNQWWNGLLTEHTAETLFLSDIDWRYTFIGGDELVNSSDLFVKQKEFFTKLRNSRSSVPVLSKSKNQTNNLPSLMVKDVVIDFPDADQYYNPKQRRWFVTSGYWNSFMGTEPQDLQTEMFEYFIFEAVVKSYTFLNNNREVLDYSVSKFIKKGLIKETNYKILLNKFSS